jgi:hypothetical protein
MGTQARTILKKIGAVAMIFGVIGFVIPLLYLALFYGRWTSLYTWPGWERLWPTSILLLATAGNENSLGSWVTVAASVLLNAGLYGLIGGVAACAWALLRRLPHDRTPSA